MRAAKARAAEQGESLKDWFTTAVARALTRHVAASARPRPWPVFGQPSRSKARVTNALLAEVEAEDGLEKYRRGLKRRK